jgi:Spy/CpxP family protein refolding chaperone
MHPARKIALAILSLNALAFAVPAWAKDRTPDTQRRAEAGKAGKDGHGGKRRGGRGLSLERLSAQLNLSEAQKARLKPILEEARASRRALRMNESVPPEERRARMRAHMERTQARIMAVLTPAQKQKMLEMRREREKNGAKRRGGRHDDQRGARRGKGNE